MTTANPYAPPSARVADDEVAPQIWNPNAAANWSLLFSPAFGAFLHMLNWRALGERDRAAMAKGWFIARLVVLASYLVVALALPDSKAADAFTRLGGFIYLFVWYFATARGQARYVRYKFGSSYPRRGWGKPILVAVLAMIGYIIFAGALGMLAGVAQG